MRPILALFATLAIGCGEYGGRDRDQGVEGTGDDAPRGNYGGGAYGGGTGVGGSGTDEGGTPTDDDADR